MNIRRLLQGRIFSINLLYVIPVLRSAWQLMRDVSRLMDDDSIPEVQRRNAVENSFAAAGRDVDAKAQRIKRKRTGKTAWRKR